MAEETDRGAKLPVFASGGVDDAEQRAAHRALRQQLFDHVGVPAKERGCDLARVGCTARHRMLCALEKEIRYPCQGRCGENERTTVRGENPAAPDLVDRRFTAQEANKLWVADITYIPTGSGFLYLAIVLDVFSRRIVGWSMATTLHAKLVVDALNMAVAVRKPHAVIHHSDQGSQYV